MLNFPVMTAGMLRAGISVFVAAAGVLALFAATVADAQSARGKRECHYRLMVKKAADADLSACEKLISAGASEASFWLGEYYNRRGADSQARDLYEKAAAKGNPMALFTIGMAYLQSKLGKKRNVGEAIKNLEQASRRDFGRAQYLYAFVHDPQRAGKFAEPDAKLAWQYYKRAAKNGDLRALVKVGKIYIYDGVAGECLKDPDISEQKAAINRSWFSSQGVGCDVKQGAGMLTNAANMGEAEAQLELARYHIIKGENAAAKYWLELLINRKKGLYDELADKGRKSALFLPESTKRITALKAKAGKLLRELKNTEGGTAGTSTGKLEEYWKSACKFKDHKWFYRCL